MTILINSSDLANTINGAGLVALTIESDSITLTNVSAALAIEGEPLTMRLTPALAGMMSAKPVTPYPDSLPLPKDEPPAHLAEHEPHEDDLALPAKANGPKIKIGQSVQRHGKGAAYTVTRVLNHGPEAWPTVWLVSEDGEVTTANAAPNFNRYWPSASKGAYAG